MTKEHKALKLALEYLEAGHFVYPTSLATAIREALAEQPAPPPECQTEAEKTAFAFGWWKALEMHRKPAQQEPVDSDDLTIAYMAGVERGKDLARAEAKQPSKPLTDAMVKRMKENCHSMEMRGAFADGWLSAEAAHGIKGEQP